MHARKACRAEAPAMRTRKACRAEAPAMHARKACRAEAPAMRTRKACRAEAPAMRERRREDRRMATRLKDTDVVIIGLGAAGGVAALPLAQAGLEVIGLEA